MVDKIIHKTSEMNNDTLHFLIYDKLDKIIIQTRKKLKNKTIPKTKNKTEDKDNSIPKTKAQYKYEDVQENRYIRLFHYLIQKGS